MSEYLTSKYNNNKFAGKDNQEMMIIILEKSKNILIESSEFLKNKEYIKHSDNIFKLVQIFEILALTVTVSEAIEGSNETFNMYKKLSKEIENLLGKKSPAEDYEYYINYIDKLKNQWVLVGKDDIGQSESNSDSDGVNIVEDRSYASSVHILT
jgi:flagellin-specific chaperone FliS